MGAGDRAVRHLPGHGDEAMLGGMKRAPIPLDRVRLDRLAFAPRASMLHVGGGPGPGLRNCPWWVSVAGPRMPANVRAGGSRIAFGATTVAGRQLGGDVVVVERLDDAYGTRLVLAGRRPLVEDTGR